MLGHAFLGLWLFLSAVLALTIPQDGNGDLSLTDLTARGDPSPGPFTTSSRWILDANGKRFKMRCVHWVAHMEVGIPEGLQHQTIDHISSWIASNNLNCVRLSYSIDMALNPTQLVSDSFTAAANLTGVPLTNMTALYNSVIKTNPTITPTTTVLDVHEAVIASLASHGVKVILDNHVSKASWCCSQSDGNGWFDTGSPDDNTRYFSIPNWLSGLTAMANVAKRHLNVIGMDLRNEMRPTDHDTGNWYKYIPQGADAIHTANPDLLIVIGGLSYDVDLSFLYNGPLDTTNWPNKVVYEFHLYTWSHAEEFSTAPDLGCSILQSQLGDSAGFILKQGQSYTGPLWMSEFGITVGNPSSSELEWLNCVVEYMTVNDAEWDLWTLGGDYYVRGGQVNYEETFGLLDVEYHAGPVMDKE